jgi:flavodoxin
MHVPDHILVVVSVHHSNTLAIAEAMSSATGIPIYQPGEEALELVRRGATPGFGSGIYFGRHHDRLLGFVDSLPTFEDRTAFVFSTSGTGIQPERLLGRFYHRRLVDQLTARGFDVVGQFGCKGFDTYGPWGKLGGISRGRPDERDLQNARRFALAMQERATLRQDCAADTATSR